MSSTTRFCVKFSLPLHFGFFKKLPILRPSTLNVSRSRHQARAQMSALQPYGVTSRVVLASGHCPYDDVAACSNWDAADCGDWHHSPVRCPPNRIYALLASLDPCNHLLATISGNKALLASPPSNPFLIATTVVLEKFTRRRHRISITLSVNPQFYSQIVHAAVHASCCTDASRLGILLAAQRLRSAASAVTFRPRNT